MLPITIPDVELWDESTQRFIQRKGQTLCLEHSLVSIKKWESKWHKPFLGKDKKTDEETIDYIRCMTLTQNVDPDIYEYLTNDNIMQVNDYIDNPMTATWFAEDKQPSNTTSRKQQIITNETIYYWLISYNIPIECQEWHLNQLLTLIRVFEVRNRKPKKMSKKALMSRNTALNKARRAQMNSTG